MTKSEIIEEAVLSFKKEFPFLKYGDLLTVDLDLELETFLRAQLSSAIDKTLDAVRVEIPSNQDEHYADSMTDAEKGWENCRTHYKAARAQKEREFIG